MAMSTKFINYVTQILLVAIICLNEKSFGSINFISNTFQVDLFLKDFFLYFKCQHPLNHRLGFIELSSYNFFNLGEYSLDLIKQMLKLFYNLLRRIINLMVDVTSK